MSQFVATLYPIMILLMFGRMVEVSLKLGNMLSYYREAMTTKQHSNQQ